MFGQWKKVGALSIKCDSGAFYPFLLSSLQPCIHDPSVRYCQAHWGRPASAQVHFPVPYWHEFLLPMNCFFRDAGSNERSVLQCNTLYNVLFSSQSHNDCSSCNGIGMFFFIAVRRCSQHLPDTLQDWSSRVSRPIVAVGFWRAISDAWCCCVFHHS